jgi:hypothetical protein
VSPQELAALDEQLRAPIRTAIAAGLELDQLAFLLTRMLPEVCDRRFAHGQVEAAFDLARGSRPELDDAIDRPPDVPR